MKLLALCYLIVVHLALLWLVRDHVRADRRIAAFHADAVAHGVRRSAQVTGAVAVFGDSRIEDFAVSALGVPAENYGIGSETVDDVAARLPRYALAQARAVVLEPGINDWWANGFKDFAARYARLLAAVPAKVPVVAAGLIGVDQGSANHRWRGVDTSIGAVNLTIRRLCAARPRCAYAPPFATQLPPTAHVGDGVHLSAEGNRLMAASLRAALAQIE